MTGTRRETRRRETGQRGGSDDDGATSALQLDSPGMHSDEEGANAELEAVLAGNEARRKQRGDEDGEPLREGNEEEEEDADEDAEDEDADEKEERASARRPARRRMDPLAAPSMVVEEALRPPLPSRLVVAATSRSYRPHRPLSTRTQPPRRSLSAPQSSTAGRRDGSITSRHLRRPSRQTAKGARSYATW